MREVLCPRVIRAGAPRLVGTFYQFFLNRIFLSRPHLLPVVMTHACELATSGHQSPLSLEVAVSPKRVRRGQLHRCEDGSICGEGTSNKEKTFGERRQKGPAEREEINTLHGCAIATFVAVPSLVLVVVLNLSIVSRGCADGRSQLQGLCTEFVLVCLHLVFVGVRSTLFVCLLSESLLRVLHRRSRVVVVLLECVGKAARAKAGGPARPLRTCLRVARAMWFVSMCQTVCDRWSQR